MADDMMQEAMNSTVNALRREMSGDHGEHGVTSTVDQRSVEAILQDWPETPTKVARTVIDKYGAPNEATATRMIWYDHGPWKRTILYRDEVPHHFPKPHTDLLEQFVDYQVPVEKFTDLAAFDGSVIPERTKGEISARCDREEMNLLAINLAHDIVSGRRTVDDARHFYAETATAFMSGERSPYIEGLRFDTQSGTNDPDSPAPGPMIEQMVRQARETISQRT